MKFIVTFLLVLTTAICAYAGFQGYNGSTSLDIFNKLQCSTGMVCTKSLGKFVMTAQGVTNQVAATATTITASQCGSTFINSGAVQMELPEASAVLGCRLTFITGDASNFDVNPDDADQILVETDAAGDAMRNATLGNSITIEAISASEWAPTATIGTWSDIN